MDTASYLAQTRDGVVESVNGLSDAQWTFKPAPERWSIAETVEHLAIIEGRVQSILQSISNAEPAPPDRDFEQIDALLPPRVLDRSVKFKAPPAASPAGEAAPAAVLSGFVEGRAKTIALLESAGDLRSHVVNHPVLGPLDGHQWILATAAHSARHTQQILELKTDPRFPTN